MKRVVVDTNVLVSFLTDRIAEQQEQARELFERAADGELELILHQTVLTEMVYVLRNLYGLSPGEAAEIFEDLLAMPGVNPLDEIVWSQVTDVWPERHRDFGDAILSTVAAQSLYDAVATFDRSFRRDLRSEGRTLYWDDGD